MTAQPEESPILTFVTDNTLSAFGALAKALGQPEKWDNLMYFEETMIVMRSFPESFQNELGQPLIETLFDAIVPPKTGEQTNHALELGIASDEEELRVLEFSHYDRIIASALKDVFEMTMQAVQQGQAARMDAQKKILSGNGALLR